MAGKIIADQIQSTTAGTLDTKYVVDGSAKVWADYNSSVNDTVEESLNISSKTDNGTGDQFLNYTNNFVRTSYAGTMSPHQNSIGNSNVYLMDFQSTTGGGKRTYMARLQTYYDPGTVTGQDVNNASYMALGDLA